jgi:phenylacetate-CoA ligase
MTIRNHITSRALLPLFDKLLGRGISEAYQEGLEWEQLPAGQLRERQWGRLVQLMTYANTHVPFYRRRFAEVGLQLEQLRGPSDLLRVPVLTKSDLLKHNRELISSRYSGKTLKRWSTGGSTGETVIVHVDGKVAGSRKAREMRFHDWMGIRPGDPSARIWGSPIEVAQYRRWWVRLGYRLKNQLFLPGHVLSDDVMAGYAKALLRFRPRLVVGFTPALFVLSHYLEKHGIRIMGPRAVVTTSATLFESHRQLHERVFGCRVFDSYGSREAGGMAFECESHPGALHVAAESVLIEIVKDGRHAPPGEVGEILLTDLSNWAAPLIRYQIKDTAAWAGAPCPCGRSLPLLRLGSGRVSDLLVTPEGGLVIGEFFIDLFDEVSDSVNQFQVIQPDRTRLLVKVVANAGFSGETEAFIRRSIRRKFGAATQIDIEAVGEIPPSPSGKYIFTRCEVPMDFLNASALLEAEKRQ